MKSSAETIMNFPFEIITLLLSKCSPREHAELACTCTHLKEVLERFKTIEYANITRKLNDIYSMKNGSSFDYKIPSISRITNKGSKCFIYTDDKNYDDVNISDWFLENNITWMFPKLHLDFPGTYDYFKVLLYKPDKTCLLKYIVMNFKKCKGLKNLNIDNVSSHDICDSPLSGISVEISEEELGCNFSITLILPYDLEQYTLEAMLK